ncbi:MAG: BamA/OMP85 family outer membrane protein, partial [bacterium]
DERLEEVMEIETGDKLDEDSLRDDLQSIFDLDYFQQVAPDFKNYDGGVELIIEVKENPTLDEVNFVGNSVYEKERMLEIMEVELGDVINMGQLGQGLQNIESELDEEGFIPVYRYPGGHHFIDFDNIEINQQGELTIPINVGVLNEIELKGNEKTKDFVILRELSLKKGEPLKANDIQENLERLYRLEFFEEIVPEPVPSGEENNEMDLILDIKERQTGTLNVGGSWSSAEGWIGQINVQERNLLGNGQRVGFQWEFGGTRNLALDFSEPRFWGSKLSVDFSLFDREKKVNNMDERGGSITLGHPITDEWEAGIRYKLVDEWENDENGQALSSERISSITLNTSQDTRNHFFNPTKGNMYDFSLEYAGTVLGSDSEFAKFDTDLRKYFPGGEDDQAWAVRLNLGTASTELSTGQKFRIGGSETLRGYDYGDFSGEHLFLTNLEYRFPLEDNFTGVLFGDMGHVWDYDQAVKMEDLKYAVGLGIRMNTPVGQLRLDYGWNDKAQGKPHFSIGQTF